MRRSVLRFGLSLSLLLGSGAFAADPAPCACGKGKPAACEAGCVCEGTTCPAHAGHGMRAGMPMGAQKHVMPVFDPSTVTTIKGRITEIVRVEHGRNFTGVHLKVKAGDETLVVHAGPSFFIDPKMTFAVNDELEATGSRIKLDEVPTLLATQLTKGGKTVQIRTPDGKPLFKHGPPQM